MTRWSRDRTDVEVLDTDVVLALLEGKRPVRTSGAHERRERAYAVASVSVGEMYRWANSRQGSAAARSDVHRLLDRVLVLPCDRRVSEQWSGLTIPPSAGVEVVHRSWIAASCLARSLDLAVFDPLPYEQWVERDRLDIVALEGQQGAP